MSCDQTDQNNEKILSIDFEYFLINQQKTICLTGIKAVNVNLNCLEKKELSFKKNNDLLLSLHELSMDIKNNYGYCFDYKIITDVIVSLNKLGFFDKSFNVYFSKKLYPLFFISNDENVIVLAPKDLGD